MLTYALQQRLNFLPLPHGQRLLREGAAAVDSDGRAHAAAASAASASNRGESAMFSSGKYRSLASALASANAPSTNSIARRR